MVYDKKQKAKLVMIVFGMFVCFCMSTINLHGYILSSDQRNIDTVFDKTVYNVGNDVGNLESNIDVNAIENHASIATTSMGSHPRVDSEDLFDLENIPVYMRDYFEWHGKKLQQMREDAKKSKTNSNDSDENDDYLSKYRFLVLRCATGKKTGKQGVVEDRCGGLSDRLKPFPLFLWYAATTNRILFIRWGRNRPAPIETFMVPGNVWNWTFPDELLKKVEKLEEAIGTGKKYDEKFARLYFDGSTNQHKQMLDKIGDQSVWMIEGNDFTGGYSRYKDFVASAIEAASASNTNNPKSSGDMFSASTLEPSDALYESFYHDLFHATFLPSLGVRNLLSAYFYDPKLDENIADDNKSDGKRVGLQSVSTRSWLPVPLERNRYAVAHYRAKYPREPYRETQNLTILRETTIHAVECAKSRVGGLKAGQHSRNTNSTTPLTQAVSAVYVASDTALVVEAVQDAYHNHNNAISEEGTGLINAIDVW
eukprot:CAMPEP_0197199224 /NCGR_PEP_ID=MMETSP1423-20130617/33776_1 /TAXON_ID=476441 /ORGANISM="Pseudo-nitzschia heimii, Strain UNC1101" /LENGTH=480 /DNA_ID=CAMNT_0042653079 /DNA_START=358 /DNA_END=1797 /DNA_ORIENTATION=-